MGGGGGRGTGRGGGAKCKRLDSASAAEDIATRGVKNTKEKTIVSPDGERETESEKRGGQYWGFDSSREDRQGVNLFFMTSFPSYSSRS